MTTRFEAFAETLSDRERDALLATVPMLIARIAGADGTFDAAEMDAAVDELIAGAETLGPAFRRSAAAEEAFARIGEMVEHPDKLEFHGHLMLLRDVVHAMPDDMAAEFKRFVLHLALHLAGASGSYFGFGNPINDDERAAIVRIVHALEIPVDDPKAARLLGITPPEKE